MKNLTLTLFSLLLLSTANAQLGALAHIMIEKEYNKEKVLHHAREYLATEVFDGSEQGIAFKIEALTAENSGSLSTVSYHCPTEAKSGVLLAFYGTFWNEAGVIYTGHAYKNLTGREATELFSDLKSYIEVNKKYVKEDLGNNHVMFNYKDMKFVIYSIGGLGTLDFYIRVYWNGLNASWSYQDFLETMQDYDKVIREQ